ncbi:MAG: helix-turn-helix transcriptional regulator [Bacteroidetes bacterium]|nr:helix-turn-helix transcriptional regulator [Bacteroidota bacterium]
MSFGKKLTEARKKKGYSQEQVAKFLGTKGPVIGRYERDEMKPSIDTAAKMASLLDISLDYLVGNTDEEVDKTMLKRVIEISNFPQEDKDHVFAVLDAFITKVKVKQIAS